jgi:hypothetical protein
MVQTRSVPLQTAVTAARATVKQLPTGDDVAVHYVRTLTTTAFGRCVLGLGTIQLL